MELGRGGREECGQRNCLGVHTCRLSVQEWTSRVQGQGGEGNIRPHHGLYGSTVIGGKPTIHYAELCTLLARVAIIVNDRPVGVRSLIVEDIVPITENQLLLGRTSTSGGGGEELNGY